MTNPDPYRLLGIEPGATEDEVRAAFRRKVRQNHPDTATEGLDDGDVQDIVEAYRLLMDPDARARHDSDTRRRERGVTGRSVRVTHREEAEQSASGSPCRACGGTGARTEEGRCSDCHGQGQVTALDRERARIVNCRRCGGRGVRRVSRVCPSCQGSGLRSG